MKVTISTEQRKNYLIIKGSGCIKNSYEEKEFAKNCYEVILKNNSKKVIIDQREIDFTSSIVDQTETVSFYNEEFESFIRFVRIAIVISPKDKELHEFWELYANNRGYPWRVFTKIEDAIEYIELKV